MTTRTVGADKTYQTMAAAIAAAGNGDRIEVDAETFTNDNITATQDDLTIVGVGATRSLMNCTAQIANGKGIFLVQGDDAVIENIEFQGAQVADGNGCAVRPEGTNITLRNCLIHDCENGMLGGVGVVTLENTEIYDCGVGDGQTHNLYITGTTFVMRYCYSHHCDTGHLVKSRAQNNYIEYNRLTDEATGNSSYLIDIPDGGLTYIIGNTMHKGSLSENSGAFISYAVESQSNPVQKVYVVNNTMANDFGATLVEYVYVEAGTTEAWIKNNFMISATTETITANGSVTQANNVQTTANPLVVGRASYDYRPTVNSPCVDQGAAPGTGASYDLAPSSEYVHPISSRARPGYAPIDCGAFEFGNSVPSWVAALDVDEWYEIPNTDLADADPAVTPPGTEGPSAKVNDWTSFVVDTSTSKMYCVAQGGHNGYAGNEVDALGLDTETPGWTEVLAPSSSVSDADYYADGRPTSRHSNYGVTYDATNSRIMLFGGNRYSSGGLRARVDSYNIGSNTYSAQGTHPDFPEPLISWMQNSGYQPAVCADPTTGNVYAGSAFEWAVWTRATNTWSSITDTSAPLGYYSMSAFDTTRNRVLVISSTTDDDRDIYTVATDSWQQVTFTGSAASAIRVQQGALIYVPALDKYLVRAAASGATVYQIDASTFEATTYSTSGGDTIPETDNGPFNKFLYVPDLGGVVYYPAYGADAWFLKLFDAAPQITEEGQDGAGLGLQESVFQSTLERQTSRRVISKW